jgi:hypothetical protein
MKFRLLSILFCFSALFLINDVYSQDRKYTIERGLNIHYLSIPAGIDSVEIDGKQVITFRSRRDAITYFINMAVKKDMTTVAVDSVNTNSTIPELYTIKEEFYKRP